MGFGEAIASGFSKYVVFSGRATRSEFWLWILFALIGAITTEILDAAIFVYHPGISPLNSPLNTLLTLVLVLPSLAVAVRRLHDADRTGWWMLIVLTVIGIFVLLYLQSQEGAPGPNRFGPNPLTEEKFKYRTAD